MVVKKHVMCRDYIMVNKKLIILLLFFLSSCTIFFYSPYNKNKLDVQDCILTIDNHYTIKKSINSPSIVLEPRSIMNQFYFISYFNNNGRMDYIDKHIRELGYKNYKLYDNKNLNIVKIYQQIDELNTSNYIVFGKTFYIYFATLNSDAENIIDSCNDTWK